MARPSDLTADHALTHIPDKQPVGVLMLVYFKELAGGWASERDEQIEIDLPVSD